jgi:hypothetical protein
MVTVPMGMDFKAEIERFMALKLLTPTWDLMASVTPSADIV